MKAKDLKPGMLFRKKCANGYSDVVLIIAIKSRHIESFEYAHFSINDSDLMIGTLYHKEKLN